MSDALRINDLVIEVAGAAAPRNVVHGVTLSVARGESIGVVGESGSGKSLTMLAALGLLPVGARTVSGSIEIDGQDITRCDARSMRQLRGRTVAMVFQDPMSALNPLRSIGSQLGAAIRVHAPRLTRAQVRERALELLGSVGVRDAAERAMLRPHQWSGGMRQRAMIAMAIAHDPVLLVADEPTTALDATVQAQVMALIDEVRERTQSALVLISHDLGLVAQNTDRVCVMRQGAIVEQGNTREMLNAPSHEYTQKLLESRPEANERRRPPREGGDPVVCVDNLRVEYPAGRRKPATRAVDDISFTIGRGETVAIVGESGSGKSSLARAVLGINTATKGTVSIQGTALPPSLAGRTAAERERAQIVFQDPFSSLDPRMSVFDLVAEPLRIRHAFRADRVTQLLADVGLDESYLRRVPRQLSGGQRQRVGIARALALTPQLLVLDEPVSALDVSIQAQVLALLDDIQRERGLAYLFISHDLGVVRSIADRVIVMHAGCVVEEGKTEVIFTNPQHPYTRTLLDAIPHIETTP